MEMFSVYMQNLRNVYSEQVLQKVFYSCAFFEKCKNHLQNCKQKYAVGILQMIKTKYESFVSYADA